MTHNREKEKGFGSCGCVAGFVARNHPRHHAGSFLGGNQLCSLGCGWYRDGNEYDCVVFYWSWSNHQRNRLESKTKQRLEAAEVPPTMTTTMKTMEHHHGLIILIIMTATIFLVTTTTILPHNSCSSNRKLPARRNNRVGCCLMMHCGYTYRCCCCSWWVFGFGSSDRLSRCCWEPLW